MKFAVWLLATLTGMGTLAAGSWLLRSSTVSGPAELPVEAGAQDEVSSATPLPPDPALAAGLQRAFGALYGPALPGEDAATGVARFGVWPETDAGAELYVQNRLGQDLLPLAKQCYDAARARNPDLRGRVMLGFVVLGDGSAGVIDEVTIDRDASTLDEPGMEECLRQSLMTVGFATPPDGGKITLSYPLDFAP
jgi:hypothetical protein